jgi:hypothetical protein
MLKLFQIKYNCNLPKLMPVTGTDVELNIPKVDVKCVTRFRLTGERRRRIKL